MISDFVKGKKKFDYAEGIQKGIMLHRAIDAYTDEHPATKQGKQYLKPAVGLYAGAFVDVVYDHFLALDKNQFLQQTLLQHTSNTHQTLQLYQQVLPPVFQQMLPYMIAQNWLFNYQYTWGIERSFGGVARRAKYIDSSVTVFALFEKHYHALQECYNAFFPDVKAFTLYQIQLFEKA